MIKFLFSLIPISCKVEPCGIKDGFQVYHRVYEWDEKESK